MIATEKETCIVYYVLPSIYFVFYYLLRCEEKLSRACLYKAVLWCWDVVGCSQAIVKQQSKLYQQWLDTWDNH